MANNSPICLTAPSLPPYFSSNISNNMAYRSLAPSTPIDAPPRTVVLFLTTNRINPRRTDSAKEAKTLPSLLRTSREVNNEYVARSSLHHDETPSSYRMRNRAR